MPSKETIAMTFKDLVPIDIARLDEEWLLHPILYHELSENTEAAEFAVEQAEAAFDAVCSELDIEIRDDPKSFGAPVNNQGKPSEGTVAAVMKLQDSYLKAKERLGEAKRFLTSLRNDLHTMDIRKSALENLVRLHGQNYFASPSAPHNVDPERMRAMKESFSTAVIRDKRKRYQERKGTKDA